MVKKKIILLSICISCLYQVFSQSIGGIVNTYVQVTGIATNAVTVLNTNGFSVGDRTLLIQMKGANINTTNTASFGQIIGLGSAGNFEFSNIASINGNTITFTANLCKPFVVGGLVQLIRVPVYTQASVDAMVTAPTWNGTTGGVVAIEASNSITFNNVIDVSGKGFTGGSVTSGWFSCNDPNYASPGTNAGKKGEGVAAAPMNLEGNRAPLANGGGGSNSGNPGAAGGANGGVGGRGGNQFSGSCPVNVAFGMGGIALDYTSFKAFLGGGGGGGYMDNGLNCTAGSNGGGIVFISTPIINGNNQSILANGASVIGNTDSEGAGGGGAGGCVYLMVQSLNSNLNVNVNGGNGGNIFSTMWSSACHGPGGGGGGGAIAFTQASLPPNVTASMSGGLSGMVLHNGPPCAGTAFGAQSGASGILVPSYVPPIPGPNPNLGNDTIICAGSSIQLQADTLFPSYTWSNGAVSPFITVNLPGIYWLDVPNGCGTARDSIVISIQNTTLNLGPNLSHCLGDSSMIGTNAQFNSYLWSTGETSNQVFVQNSGTYTLVVTDSMGCMASDTITVTVNPIPNISLNPNFMEICAGEGIYITANGGIQYQWSNGSQESFLSEIPLVSESLLVIGYNAFGCQDTATVSIIVHPNPMASVNLLNGNLQSDDPVASLINNSNGQSNSIWDFGDGTVTNDNSTNISHIYPAEDGNFMISLLVSNDFGCLDSTAVSVSVSGEPIYYVPNTFTPDGDEHNNSFKPVFTTGFDPSSYQLSIYNRWGTLIFESMSPAEGWPGYYNGLKAMTGTYTYVILFFDKKENRLKTLEGHVNLIR